MNPFALVYDALWTMALASATISELVKPGNRVRFDEPDRRDPAKKTLQAADFPELWLVPSGSQAANLHANSCSASITRRYEFILHTGDLRMTESLLTVEWQLFCALVNWQSVLGALTWKSVASVKHTRLVEVRNGTIDQKRADGMNGWSAVWACDVDLMLPRQLMIGELSDA